MSKNKKDDKKKKNETDHVMTPEELYEFEKELEQETLLELYEMAKDDENLIIVDKEEDLVKAVQQVLGHPDVKKDPNLKNVLGAKRIMDITMKLVRSVDRFTRDLKEVSDDLVAFIDEE